MRPLAKRLAVALEPLGAGWEAIFVDDSDDLTPQVVAELVAREGANIRLLHRAAGQRCGGLGGAVKAGLALARGDVVAVMDGDLQHPPEVLLALALPVLAGQADLAVGSRYGRAGRPAGLSSPWRRGASRAGRWLAHLALSTSRPLEDPLSGLFCLRRCVLDNVELRPNGYKILLEVAVRGRWTTSSNVAYTFGPRLAGRSKATLHEGLAFLCQLGRLAMAQHGRGRRAHWQLSEGGPADQRVAWPLPPAPWGGVAVAHAVARRVAAPPASTSEGPLPETSPTQTTAPQPVSS